MDNCFFCGAEGIACYTKTDDKGVDHDACFACAKGPAVGPPIVQTRRPVGANASMLASAAPVSTPFDNLVPAAPVAEGAVLSVAPGTKTAKAEPKLRIQKPAYVAKAEKTEDLAAAYATAIASRKDREAILAGTAECKNGHKICLENANPADLRRIQKYYCQPCIKGYAGKK